jgi:hypothetical protein
MFPEPTLYIRGYAGVKRTVAAAQDVDEPRFITGIGDDDLPMP